MMCTIMDERRNGRSVVALEFWGGSGKFFSGGVNYFVGENDDYKIYAECETPEGAESLPEDYGYLTLKAAVLKAVADLPITLAFPFKDDGLSAEAAADCRVHVDIEEL